MNQKQGCFVINQVVKKSFEEIYNYEKKIKPKWLKA